MGDGPRCRRATRNGGARFCRKAGRWLILDGAFARQNHGALQHVAQFAHVARPVVPFQGLEHGRRNVGDAALVLAVQVAQQRLGDGPGYPPCARAAAADECGRRSGGSNRSSRKCPPRTASSGTLLVAATTRTSTSNSVLPPSRRTLESSRMRSSLACVCMGISPISSSSRVPCWATSKQPARRSEAPVNDPFSCPNSSLSISVSGQRRAVDGHEGPLAPRAQGVHRARHQFLAGAALAGDQHASLARSGLLQEGKNFLHLGRSTHQFAERALIAELALQDRASPRAGRRGFRRGGSALPGYPG